MQRAALYARVSTDAQKQEGTIESQIAELRRQITVAGHVLVKEYIDDGYTGNRMDRPALQELRRDTVHDPLKDAKVRAAASGVLGEVNFDCACAHAAVRRHAGRSHAV